MSKGLLRLEPEGMVYYERGKGAVVRFSREETKAIWQIDEFPYDVPGPEVVHLEISGRCNLSCPYCYVEKGAMELGTSEWKEIIDQLAGPSLRIFQLTFGGGEPLLRDDIFDLARYVNGRGLDLTMTTNGLLVPTCNKDDLKLFDAINVSYHGDLKILEDGLGYLKDACVSCGINFIAKKEYQNVLSALKDIAKEMNAEILFLSYKTYEEPDEVLPPEEVHRMAESASQEVRVAVDGSVVGQCWCNYRFVDIDALGNIMPCSFIREPMGNLLEKPFRDIWESRDRYQECPYFPLNNHHCWDLPQEGRYRVFKIDNSNG
jgi:MoaA/NifB/PqqE/SkfB family radical SAM enzyme